MIERIEWKNHHNELPSPFMRGKGERPLRITFHSQSLINLSDEENSIVELLRELVKLQELESFETSQMNFPDFPVREPNPKCALASVDLVPMQNDIFITKSGFFLENHTNSIIREINPRTLFQTVKIVGLFLRSRDIYSFRMARNIPMSFSRGLFYMVLTRYRLPQMWKYYNACVYADKTPNEDLQGLGESVFIRSVRAFEAQDAIGIQFYHPQNYETRDQIMYHFDYLTLVLSGALDAQARVANRVYQINKKGMSIGFQKKSFVEALKSGDAQKLYDFVNDQKFQNLITLLNGLRNTVHTASLKTVAYQESAQAIQSLVKLPDDIKNTIWDATERLGSAHRWGLIKKPGEIFFEPYSYSTSLVEESLKAINEIAAATDVTRLFKNKPIPSLIEVEPENSPFIWGKRLSLLI